MTRLIAAAVLTATALGFMGCDSGKPKIETVQAPPPNALNEAKAVLTNYVNGQPVASEAESFDELVQRVRAVDSAKADILEACFKSIKANRGSAKSKAQETLKKL